jgi:serine/threonine protein kinase
MFCRNCGTTVESGAAFCGNCGTPMEGTLGGAVATATSDPAGAVPPVDMSPNADDTLLQMTKEHLGKDYRIDKELGRGGMAVVYKGVEIALERTVAIKVVPPDSANVGQAAERFKREAKLAASLDHPNIIPVYRVGQAGPLHFMAMKFVEGRAVDSIIEAQGALPLSICVAILKYSALGLAFAHDRKIVHRDIKPANILVDKDGRVMVSDFGIARALEEVSMTASGMMIGTPYYMSPEQCGGQKVSPQSDQYSLGIMGFQMITGEVPFLAESMVGVIQHHYMTPVPDILAVRSDVPKELLDVIYCSLNKDPADRFATTKDMATALENIPLSDKEVAEAETLLRELSAGKAIPKVRTGTLPPLSLTISGPGPKVAARPATQPKPRTAPAAPVIQPKRKKKKKNKPLLVGMISMMMLTLGGGTWMVKTQMDAKAALDARQRADSVRRTDSIRAANEGSKVIAIVASDGKVIDSAAIILEGVAYRNGAVFRNNARIYDGSVEAPGYVTQPQRVILEGGVHDTLTIRMMSDAEQQIAQANARGAANPGGQPRPVALDSNQVRFIVNPLTANVLINNTRVGSGRFQVWVREGTHTVRYSAQNCEAQEVPLTVRKGDIIVMPPVTLVCR